MSDKIKWFTRKTTTTESQYFSYVDSRDVQDALNERFGDLNWGTKYNGVSGKVFCELTVFTSDGRTITRSDTGSESTYSPDKGLASDAFKRAAYRFGFFREVYSFRPITLPMKQHSDGKFYPCNPDTGKFIKPDELNAFLTARAKSLIPQWENEVEAAPETTSTEPAPTPPKPQPTK